MKNCVKHCVVLLFTAFVNVSVCFLEATHSSSTQSSAVLNNILVIRIHTRRSNDKLHSVVDSCQFFVEGKGVEREKSMQRFIEGQRCAGERRYWCMSEKCAC